MKTLNTIQHKQCRVIYNNAFSHRRPLELVLNIDQIWAAKEMGFLPHSSLCFFFSSHRCLNFDWSQWLAADFFIFSSLISTFCSHHSCCTLGWREATTGFLLMLFMTWFGTKYSNMDLKSVFSSPLCCNRRKQKVGLLLAAVPKFLLACTPLKKTFEFEKELHTFQRQI